MEKIANVQTNGDTNVKGTLTASVKQLTKDDFFFCYSGAVRSFLMSKGFRYILKAQHDKTGNPYWLFHKSSELCQALDEWGTGVKIKRGEA